VLKGYLPFFGAKKTKRAKILLFLALFVFGSKKEPKSRLTNTNGESTYKYL
jgi:hypothetical protein